MRFIILFLFPFLCNGQDFIADVYTTDDYKTVAQKINIFVSDSGLTYKGVKMKKDGKKCLALVPSLAPGEQNADMWSEYYFVFEKGKIVFYTEILSVRQFNEIKSVMDSGYGYSKGYAVRKEKTFSWTTPCCYVLLKYTGGNSKFEMSYKVR